MGHLEGWQGHRQAEGAQRRPGRLQGQARAEVADLPSGLVRPALGEITPYEPGKPVEEVQRELGLERVTKLASNEGPFGPFPAAVDALESGIHELNRYPDGGAFRLRAALAEKHAVRFEEVALGAGADAIIDLVSQATLDPGDEIVCGWPSFPSYVIDALKMGAEVRRIPLRDHRYDLEAMLEAISPSTKLAYICHPNNPTGTMNTRGELDHWFERVPEHVLTVLDQAYFEYIDHPDYADGIEEYAKADRNVVVLRTFSKIYGLAGLRVGYGIGSEGLVTATGKVRRAFDISHLAQVAALASLGDEEELARRRKVNQEGLEELERALRTHGLDPVTPSYANFLYVEVHPEDSRPLFEQLLREGVIVRPLSGFGAAGAIRFTVGTPEENAHCAEALGKVLAQTAS